MLKVNEVFGPTIQGEGKSAGKRVVFLRLALCNLSCIWCDTPYTWNFVGSNFAHPEKFQVRKEVHLLPLNEIIVLLESISDGVKSLVISGGEPLIQQRDLIPLLQVLKNKGWWIEIETNGTIIPEVEFEKLVDQFNCSPKLSNSLVPKAQRIRVEALRVLASNPKSTFKFVIGNDSDATEVMDLVRTYGMNQVYLMPLGKYVDELAITREPTKALAEKLGLNFSDRLHVIVYGGKRGV